MNNDDNDQLKLMSSEGDTDPYGNPNCEPFPVPPSNDPYRYFNQPIEQVPGWNPGKAQILYHAKNHGLLWQDIPDCVDIIECAEISGYCESPELKFKQRRIRPIQDEGQLVENTCPSIPLQAIDVVTCVSVYGGELVIQRQKIYVLGVVGCSPSPDCYNIPLESCPDVSSGDI